MHHFPLQLSLNSGQEPLASELVRGHPVAPLLEIFTLQEGAVLGSLWPPHTVIWIRPASCRPFWTARAFAVAGIETQIGYH
jgi:hypothetical protein